MAELLAAGALIALVALSQLLAPRGFHPLAVWWRAQFERFDRHPTARILVARVGRGGLKSYTAVLWAVAQTIYGKWKVPPGERHFFAFVSVSVGEALQRLNLVAAILDALKIRYKRVGDEIHLLDAPLGFKVFSCTVGAVSGFRCIGFVCDEVAKWRYQDSNLNPAAEVIASLKAMCVTHPLARGLIVSSPWSESDYHATLMAVGDTDYQLTCEAPTWVANPSISEEQTKQLERDPKIWSREYAAIPMASSSPAFESLADSYTQGLVSRPPTAGVAYAVTGDFGGHNSGYGATASHIEFRQAGPGREVQRVLVLDKVVSLTPSFMRPVTFQAQVQATVRLCKEYGVKHVLIDQHMFDPALEALKQYGITAKKADMSVGAQARRSSRYAGRHRAGTVELLDHKELLDQHREALSVERQGGFIIKGNGRTRDDLLDCCLLSCDEEFDRLPAGGSDIRRDLPRVVNMGGGAGGINIVGGVSYYRLQSDGTKLPVETPRSDPMFDEHRRARWAKGVFTPSDLQDYTEAELVEFSRNINT